jgi:hypothetical protein
VDDLKVCLRIGGAVNTIRDSQSGPKKMFSLNTLDAEIDRLEKKIKPSSKLSGQDFANEVLAVATATRAAIAAMAQRLEKLEDRTGESSGPGSLGRTGT